MDAFLKWFESSGGSYDHEVVSLIDIPGQGRGAVALKDVQAEHVLFSLPRSLTLSTRTSNLPRMLEHEWKRLELHKGWAGLILCMMFEEFLGENSKWYGYLRSLPDNFDTPMFWTEDELAELKGTTVEDKIGKDSAERDFLEKVVPVIRSRPDLFPSSSLNSFTLERYHIMGSRILSRGFHVEKWEDPTPGNETSQDMDVDPESDASGNLDDDLNDDDDEEEEEDPADVAMVPFADILNARYGSENAKLYYEGPILRMVSTKNISSREQIWNTYGDPPNSDLLRRYGHVDLIPLSDGTQQGNPADIVEVRADLLTGSTSLESDSQTERLDWWLEEGGDDRFELDSSDIPEILIQFARLLTIPESEWQKLRSKGKPPKSRLDDETRGLIVSALNKRLGMYPTTLEEDYSIIQSGSLTLNKRNALVVRIGEKRILTRALGKLRNESESESSKKRKADDQLEAPNRKSKR